MSIQECLEILRLIKSVAFATVDEEGNPQVRIIDVMLVEEEKLFFCTARGKDFYKQLITSGKVAITGLNSKYQTVRLNGVAKRVENQKKKIDQIFEANPSMKEIYPDKSRYILEAFCIDNGEVEFFDLGKTPIYRETFKFKDSKEPSKKGFIINDNCISCGLCSKNCPQNCINKGKPYSIIQEKCLHCGLCYENCPVKAISRRGI